MRIITRIAPDVGWLPISFANIYFVGRPGGAWILVDAGLPGRGNQILEAAEARFGAGARPAAILLTLVSPFTRLGDGKKPPSLPVPTAPCEFLPQAKTRPFESRAAPAPPEAAIALIPLTPRT